MIWINNSIIAIFSQLFVSLIDMFAYYSSLYYNAVNFMMRKSTSKALVHVPRVELEAQRRETAVPQMRRPLQDDVDSKAYFERYNAGRKTQQQNSLSRRARKWVLGGTVVACAVGTALSFGANALGGPSGADQSRQQTLEAENELRGQLGEDGFAVTELSMTDVNHGNGAARLLPGCSVEFTAQRFLIHDHVSHIWTVTASDQQHKSQTFELAYPQVYTPEFIANKLCG
jgi:hypothetical protein